MTLKKGFCTGAKDEWQAKKLASLEVDWWYSWGKEPGMGEPVNDFTPMVWGRRTATPEAIAEIDSNYWKYQNTYLLGFNEPDHAHQANMSVDEALSLWPTLMKSRAKLVSPATTQPRAEWMGEFMRRAIARGYRIDAVAVHIYQNPNAAGFLQKVDEVWEKWGKPIWITETCVADWEGDPTYTRAQVNEYLQEIYAGCQARPYVHRFSWKTRDFDDPIMGRGALFDNDGNRTSTGRLYTSL